MQLYPNLILDALKNVRYPASGKNIVEAGMVEDDIRIDGNKVSFSLIFDKPTDPFIKSIVRAAESAIETYISPEVDIKGNIAVKTRTTLPQPAAKPLAQVKNIIGVSSGKGAWANRPWPATLPWPSPAKATAWGCSTPTFSARRCQRCSAWRMTNSTCIRSTAASS